MKIILIKPENREQLKATKAVLKLLNVSFVSREEERYDPAFVKKIEISRKQAKEGKVTAVDFKNLCM